MTTKRFDELQARAIQIAAQIVELTEMEMTYELGHGLLALHSDYGFVMNELLIEGLTNPAMLAQMKPRPFSVAEQVLLLKSRNMQTATAKALAESKDQGVH